MSVLTKEPFADVMGEIHLRNLKAEAKELSIYLEIMGYLFLSAFSSTQLSK